MAGQPDRRGRARAHGYEFLEKNGAERAPCRRRRTSPAAAAPSIVIAPVRPARSQRRRSRPRPRPRQGGSPTGAHRPDQALTGPAGRLVVLGHTSKVLEDNPLGDRSRGRAVWLPPQYDDPAAPAAASRCSTTWSASPARACHTELEHLQRERARARRAPDPREEDGAGDHRLPRLLHRARRQPVRQLVGDRQLRRLPHEGDHALRRPRVPHARLARASRLLRQVLRRLRRDHPRHEVPEVLGRDRRPLGRRLLRLRLLARLAEHAERARQVPPPQAQGRADRRAGARPQRRAWPRASTTGASRRFLEAVWAKHKLGEDEATRS